MKERTGGAARKAAPAHAWTRRPLATRAAAPAGGGPLRGSYARRAGGAEFGAPGVRRAAEVAWLHVASKALSVALELRLFAAVGEGGTAAEVAARAGVNERGARMVLDALAPFGLVRKEGRRYLLSAEARDALVPGRPGYVGEHLLLTDALRPDWDALAEVVRTGKPASRVDEAAQARDFFPRVARHLYASNLPVAERAAARLDALGLRPRRVLDVAAGSAVWSIAVAAAFPEALVTALDFAETLQVAREMVAARGLSDRFAYLEGNLREVDLGVGGYDLVVLGHILHSEGEARARELLRRVARALRPGGACLVAEMIPDEGRRERVFPLLFALNMLLRTTDGDAFTLPELRSWLLAAGFAKVAAFDAGAASPLVLARMAGGARGGKTGRPTKAGRRGKTGEET